MSGYFHKGRHRKPTTTRRKMTSAGILSMLLSGGVAAFAPPASADTLDSIEKCESGGQLRATNGTHFGLFQFDLRTWQSVGGKGNPMNASRAEQRARAETLLASRGTQPWLASQHCWGSSSKPVSARHSASKPAPKAKPAAPAPVRAAVAPKVVPPARHTAEPPRAPHRAAQRVARATNTVTVAPGDTLSAIAAAHHRSWRALWASNRGTIHNPNLIFPGERITVA